MNRQGDRRNPSFRWSLRRKIVASALLSVAFSFVLFSVPPEKLAWEGPLVMGTLAMPSPAHSKAYRLEPKADTDAVMYFLGFLSVIGIILLGWGGLRPPRRRTPQDDPAAEVESGLPGGTVARPRSPFP